MRLFFLVLMFNIFWAAITSAQAPHKFSYQAVIRNQGNSLVVNRQVGLRFTILRGNANGVIVYCETHTTTTNQNGMVSLEIGAGTALFNSISNINWAQGPYFLKTETDPNGGVSYTISGTTQMLSVPYALYAETSANPGNPGYNTIIKNDPVYPGTGTCRFGGFKISFGLDLNRNNILDGNEIENSLTRFVCNGKDGKGIISTVDNGNGTFTFTYTDGTTFTTSNLTGPMGAIGPQGPAGQPGATGPQGIAGIGIVSTVNNSNGTYTFNYSDGSSFTTGNLTGPAGAIGPQGLQGPAGPAGTNGAIGPQGPAGTNGTNGVSITNSYVQGDSLFVVLSNGQTLNTGYVRGPMGTAAPTQTLSQNGSNITLSNGGGTVSINDADSNPTNELELPATAGSAGQVLTTNGSGSVYWNTPSSSAAGAVMYIYNDQQCPAGWTKQEINVQIWGVTPVDACWTTQPCLVMYIYNGQTCPSGWIFHDISAAVINESTIPVDACIKY